jgi:hypothetical protein
MLAAAIVAADYKTMLNMRNNVRRIMVGITLILCNVLVYSQGIIFPPELIWWINEVKKANPEITIEKFVLENVKEIDFNKSKIAEQLLYPVFARWNYSGNYVAYFNVGIYPRKVGKRYHLDFDVDSHVYIINKKSGVYINDSYGSSSGVDDVNWIKDDVLIGVGTETTMSNNEYIVNIFINEYTIGTTKVEVKKYIYRNAFDINKREGLKLNWFEQRPDYFEY